MKRSLVAILVLGLLVGSLAAVAEAKKKPVKASELKYYLHWDTDGATPDGCTGAVHMSLVDSEDSTCSTTAQVAQEALIAVGDEPVSYVHPASDGLPFTLDASRKLTGSIVLTGTVTAEAYVQLVLSGSVGGQPVTLAEGETTTGNGAVSNSVFGLVQLPGPAAELPVDLEIDKAFDKKKVAALSLQVTIRGVHRGGVDYEVNPSHIVVPAWK